MGSSGKVPKGGIWEVDVPSKTLIFKVPMLVAKEYGCSICHDGTYIYSIGGNYSGNSTADVEAYNVAESKWYHLPDLTNARYWSVSMVF